MSEELLVRHCSPTLAGMKTGNLFMSPFESEGQMRRDVQDLNRRLQNKGLRVVPMRFFEQRALLYVYRPAKLAKDLQHDSKIQKMYGRLLQKVCRRQVCGTAHCGRLT